jgi:Tol biopolymer transport system component
LWRVPLLGGTPRRIVSDIWSAPGWSPDGRRMAFVRTKGVDQDASIIIANDDGTHEQVLVTRRPPAGFLNISYGAWATNRPAWSPDGKRLILVGTAETDSALIVLDAANGAETRTVPIKPGLAWEAAWLDDTHVLLNSSTSVTSPPGLWSLDLTDRRLIPITRDFSFFHWIGLTADRRTGVATKSDMRGGLWLGNALGENGRPVLRETAAGAVIPFVSGPVVDAGGGVVYAAYTNGESGLFRVAPEAAKPTMLGVGGGGGFAITPDGRFVVFSSPPDTALYRVNSDGSGRIKLVDRNAGGPAITADGQTALFSPFGSPGLYSVPMSGGPARELTKLFAGNAPSVSPDGTRLLFASSKTGISILCDLPDCSNTKELELKSSRWAPDGQGVAYINEQDHGNLWEQPLDGRAPRALTHFPDAQILDFAWSSDYKRLVLSRGRLSDDIVLLKGLR